MNDQSTEPNDLQRTDENSQVVDVTPPSRALTREQLTSGAVVAAIIPRTFEDVQRIANVSVRSGLLSRDLNSLERATVAIMFGAEIGLKPMAALQRIAVINGRPCIWGDAVPAIAFDTGEVMEFEEYVEGEGDQMTAYCKVGRKLRNGAVIRKVGKFSVAQAKKAKLWDEREIVTRKGRDGSSYQKENDSPWFRFPERMLTMRARVALRDLFADAMCGLYIAEELVGRDADAEMRDVTPQYERIANPLGGNGDNQPVTTEELDKVQFGRSLHGRPETSSNEDVKRDVAQEARQEAAGEAEAETGGNQSQEQKPSPEPAAEAGNGKKQTSRKRTRPDGGTVAEEGREPTDPGAGRQVGSPSSPPRPDPGLIAFPKPWNRQSAASYVQYALGWVRAYTDADRARGRWADERAIRNGLANPLDKMQMVECQDALGKVGI